MADILWFPTERSLAAAPRADAAQLQAGTPAATSDADAWAEENAADDGDRHTVASLAAAPSSSLAQLAAKMEVLIARLAQDDGSKAGLCMAEVSLLRSVLRDLQAFVTDTVFATQGVELWVSGSTPARFVQGNGTCSSAGAGLMHHQI